MSPLLKTHARPILEQGTPSSAMKATITCNRKIFRRLGVIDARETMKTVFNPSNHTLLINDLKEHKNVY
jgi:hypothetical protein